MERSEKLLVQMKDIVDFTGISENTIKKMIDQVGFPARLLNGTWYSHTDAIEDWMYDNCYLVNKRTKKLKADDKK